MERSESIAKLIIMSYTIAILLLLLINSLVNFFSVGKLEGMMQYYTERNLEHEAFIPLPFFMGGDINTSVTETSDIDHSNYDQA